MPSLAGPPRSISLDLQPIEAAAACRHLPGFVFFDTALDESPCDALSVLAARPCEVIRGHSDAAWETLRGALRARQTEARFDDGLPAGFAAGFVEYDGTFCFGIYEDALIFRHASQSWHETGDFLDLLSHGHPEAGPCVGNPRSHRSPGRMPGVPAAGTDCAPSACAAPPHFRPRMTSGTFRGMVARAQEYIAAGDIYQVNLSHPFAADWDGDAFAFYEALRHYSPAPQAAFMELGGRSVLSASPESFLKISGRAIRTRPIKGTRPRRADATADALSAYDLRTSPKEIAELVMITDLERSDLGRVCEYGSVSVRELLKVERFEQVYHLVSTVEGQLRPEVDHIAALRACFPGGSITGAPKKRAREIIAELEPFQRGLYTGAIGWFGFNGESQFSIAIRTVIIENGCAHFHVGAGIVADSNPASEWQETLDKAAGILLAAERFGRG